MGILYIVATPIGNLEDITIRAIRTLFTVDFIVCEDTRKTGQLLHHLKKSLLQQCHPALDAGSPWIPGQARNDTDIDLINSRKPRLISYYDEIEFKRVPEIMELLHNDKNVALVSDSGTPLISDPGYKLVRECIKCGIRIVSIPGPTSLITALTSSGLPPNNFLFLGYLPPKKTQRQKILKSIFSDMLQHRHLYTIIFFETAHRLKESLEDLKEVFGDIEIVIARELTKIHEDIFRGKISKTVNNLNLLKGEIIILFNIPQV